MPTLLETLTEREHDILLCLSEGLSNQQIADRLHVALTTVKWYNTQIFSKLHASGREEAVAFAREQGLLDLAEETRLAHVVSGLPSHMTGFIGRQRELSELSQILSEKTYPILSILGPGGMGKTRLASALATRHAADYSDGVYFISLAGLNSVEGVTGLIAETIGAPTHGDNSTSKGLASYLQNQEMLLVLDNFEHLMEATDALREIIAHTRDVQIIVTSRERLNLQGESVYVLGGMEFSTQDDDAIRLFLQAAIRARAGFELDEEDLPHLARICALTEGMPLGLELAAGWVDMLSLEQISAELEKGIGILDSDLRDLPERHRSIRATIDYTWHRLSEPEAQAFIRLSVFRGGFDAEAAREVTGADLRLLRRLVNKSMVMVGLDGRYDIHELLRQYGEMRLEEAGLSIKTRSAHARYFTRVFAPLGGWFYLINAEDRALMDRDINNIRTAWIHMIEVEDFEGLDSLRGLIVRHIVTSAAAIADKQLLQDAYQLLCKADNPPEKQRICANLALSAAQILNYSDGELSLTYMNEALSLLEPFGESQDLALALAMHVNFQIYWQIPDDRSELLATLERALRIGKETQADSALFPAYYTQVKMILNNPAGNAADTLDQIEQIVRKVDALSGVPPLVNLIWFSEPRINFLILSERFDEAEHIVHEILPHFQALHDLYAISTCYFSLCKIYMLTEKPALARQQIFEILQWHLAYGQDWQILGGTMGIANLWYTLYGDPSRAVEALAFVGAHPRAIPDARSYAGRCLEDLREKVAADEFEAALDRASRHDLRSITAWMTADLSA